MSGWEPSEVTRYEYDAGGLLVAAITEREAEWSRTDVESLIAYIRLGAVGPHGWPMDLATSPDGNPSNPNKKFDWVIPPPTADFLQAALSRKKREYAEKYPDADMTSLLWRAEQQFISSE